MKIYNYILAGFVSFGFLSSCGNEDSLIGEEIQINNIFLPDANDHSKVAELRRTFYKKENSFLLFNDTLYHEQIGTTASGEPYYKTETLDILYSVGSTNQYANNFIYGYLLKYDEQKEASAFLSERILPHLGKKLRPFSWLLVSSIKQHLYGDVYDNFKVLSGERCLAIAVGDLLSLSEGEKNELANSLQIEVLSGALASKPEMNEFYAFCEGLYEQFDFNYSDYEDHSVYTYTCGFLTKKKNPTTGLEMNFHPNKSTDVHDYINLVFSSSEEEVRTKFEKYPKVLKKYDIVKTLIDELGYIF